MSQIKQLLRLHEQGKGNRTIARHLGISRNTVKDYISKYRGSPQGLKSLLSMEDHDLERFFHTGNPAYKDDRFDKLSENLDYYVKELKRTGVTRKLLWEPMVQNR
ncbi:MAG: helix-turn-helix domain-containing protein [Bacteroidales bacterium]